MISRNIYIIDPSLENGATADHKLVVKVAKDSFMYSILDTSLNMFIALGFWSWQAGGDISGFAVLAKDFKEDLMVLKQKFQETLVIIDIQGNTLIPDKLYLQDQSKKYLDFNHTFDPNEKIHTDDISLISAKNIYRMPYEIENFISKTLLSFEYRHNTTTLVNSAISNNIKGLYTLINISSGKFDVVISSGDSLKFCNTFIISSEQDIIYYLLNVYKQLKINTSTPLVLTGEIEKDSTEFELIKKYLRNVSFGKTPDIYKYSDEIKALPQHKYFTLFNAFLCG